MNFNSVNDLIIQELIKLVGKEYVLFDVQAFEKYGRDET